MEKHAEIKMVQDEITSYDQLPLVLTVQDVARVLKLGVGMVYELLRSGELPSRRKFRTNDGGTQKSSLVRVSHRT